MIIKLAPLVAGVILAGAPSTTDGPSMSPDWSINATAIEACSCPMFCQCYFNLQPAAHHEHGAGGEGLDGSFHVLSPLGRQGNRSPQAPGSL